MLHNNPIISQKTLNEKKIRQILKKICKDYLIIADKFKFAELKQTFTNPENSQTKLKMERNLYALIDSLMISSSQIKKIIIPEDKKLIEILLRVSIISNHIKFIKTLYTLHSKDILYYNKIDGKTSLQFACFLECEEVIHLLIKTQFYTSSYRSKEKNDFDHIPYPLRKNLILRLRKIINKYYPIRIYYKIEIQTFASLRNALKKIKIMPVIVLDPLIPIKFDIVQDEILPSIYYSALNDNTKALRIILLDLVPSISKKLEYIEGIIFNRDSSSKKKDYNLNMLNAYKVNESVTRILETRFKLLELEISSNTIFWHNILFILKASVILYPLMIYNILSTRKKYYLTSDNDYTINSIYHFLEIMHTCIDAASKVVENFFLSSYQKDGEITNLIRKRGHAWYFEGVYEEEEKTNITTSSNTTINRGIIIARIMIIGLFFAIPIITTVMILTYKISIQKKIFRENYAHFIENIIDTIRIKPKTQKENLIFSNHQPLSIYFNEIRNDIYTIDMARNSHTRKILTDIQNLYKESIMIFDPLKKDFDFSIIDRRFSIKKSLLELTNKMLKSHIFHKNLSNQSINRSLLETILRSAIISSNTKMIQYIYKTHKEMLVFAYKDAKYPLQFACFFGFNDSAKLLIKIAGYKIITEKNSELKTALHYAALVNNIYILKYMLIKLSFLLNSMPQLVDVIYSKDIYNHNFTTILNIKDTTTRNMQYDLYQISLMDKKTQIFFSKILRWSSLLLIFLIHVKIWFFCISPTERSLQHTAHRNKYWILTYPIDIAMFSWTAFMIFLQSLCNHIHKKDRLTQYLKYVNSIINKVIRHNKLSNKVSYENLEEQDNNSLKTVTISSSRQDDNLSLEIRSIFSISDTDDVDTHEFQSIHI